MTMQHIRFIISIITIILLTSCKSNKAYNTNFTDADGYNTADSLVNAAGDMRDWPRLLALCDSFETTGDLSPVKLVFYRTIAYNILGQYRTSLNYYYQLANIDVKKLTTQADIESYVYSYKDYVRLMCEMRRYDRALRQARIVDNKLRAAGQPSFLDHHDIAQIIGECQLCLGQSGAAAESFKKSLQGMKQRLITNCDPLDLRECQKTMNAIATVYMRRGMFDDAAPWIYRQDTLYTQALKRRDRDTVYLDEMRAEINYTRAMHAWANGHTATAEKAFAEYQQTETSKRQSNIINSCRYLMVSGRMQEAVKNYEQLDQFMQQSGYEKDLENISRFFLPKYYANLQAGRTDSAIRVATQIANSYDSALIQQKIIDADLLSTVYDTEGKERKIAEQNAKISKQQTLAVGVVSLILIIFLHIYLLERRRAYRRLDEKNKQLMLANEKAKESNRMKNKFIKQISHEVRTPLNVLSGFTQVLANKDIEISNDELQSISQKIVENSERITHLVDKMLDLSEVNLNATIELTDHATAADVAHTAISQSGILQAKHLNFVLQISREAKALRFSTNIKAASKALSLLLDNAIKFTHPLAMAGKEQTDKAHAVLTVTTDQQNVIFAIEDNGVGVPAQQAENIFKEFVQLDEYSDGTGIGLSIARQLARHMGGDVVLDTHYTAGARFVMTLKIG